MIVMINAGHAPGIDPGAVGPAGTQEATVCKNIANRAISYLAQAGIDAYFVQDDSLYNVVDTAEAMHADLFVSIHCNAAGNPAAEGTETFYHPTSDVSRALAECIHAQLVGLGLTDRGTKDGSGLYVVRRTSMPTVLVECEFISNPDREMWLASDAGQDELAAAIARGVTDYQGAM